MAVKPVPDGYHTVTPYLFIRGAARAIEFYQKAFDAKVLLKMEAPGGKIGHAEIKVGDSVIMMADEYPELGFKSPDTLGGASSGLLLYFPDVDARFARLVAAGAKVIKPLEDQFYGDRSGTVADPFGQIWTVATHTEDVPEKEMAQRAAEYAKKQGIT